MEIVMMIAIAFVLDLILGDPHFLPHPICLIGNLISFLEKALRKAAPDTPKSLRRAGVVLWFAVVSLSFAVPYFLLKGLAAIHPWLSYGVETVFCYQILAAKSMKTEAMRVYRYIREQDLPNSRKYLSWIVGRDTEHLDFKQITKAVVETVAENTSDGVIAPLLYMVIGGAPLGFLYKGVNTLDSMVGYKNDTYIDFGRFSARMDDVFNYIPARITAIAMIVSSCFIGFDGKNAWRIYRRDRYKHASPNSAHPESACAGALNIQLAGDAYYFGKLCKKQTLGDPMREIQAEDIARAVRLMYGAAVLCLAVFEGMRMILVLL